MNDDLGIQVLNTVLNYVQKRHWIDYDDFCHHLSDRITKERPTTESDLVRIVNDLKTSFFRLNDNLSRKIFIENISPSILRAVASSPSLPPSSSKLPTKILFLAANPKDITGLRLDQEVREIEQKISLAQMKDEFILVNRGAVQIGDLQLYLNQERPNIVHFCGHGSEQGEIILEDKLGRARSVPPKALARVFKILKDNIRCVVLNACFSLKQAQAIKQHIDCVIGMSSSITDDAATTFSSAFYLGVASGRSVYNAFNQGINELMLWDLAEEHIPQLLTRDGIDPSKLFLHGR